MNVIRRPAWQSSERSLTEERDYLNRRQFIARTGFSIAGLSLGLFGSGCSAQSPVGEKGADGKPLALSYVDEGLNDLFPAKLNEAYKVERALTDEIVAATYNNFYEFGTKKEKVWREALGFEQRPWDVKIGGLCEKAGETIGLEDIARLAPMEERRYRFRCVEAWAMTVPWSGYPLAKLVEWCQPKPEAKFVRFLTFDRPSQASGQAEQTWYKWPYYEALRMDEAMNEMALLAFGIYGHPFPMQHGAPLRVIAPWKYGYKNPKSIAAIEFTATQPKTFWNDAEPREYSFLSNVEPHVPHPRWSQASERLIGSGERVPTLLYNGYAEQVGALYA
jgi:sulfoxide reductase catalytic subunit YedY